MSRCDESSSGTQDQTKERRAHAGCSGPQPTHTHNHAHLLRSSTVWPGLAADSKASVTADRIRLLNRTRRGNNSVMWTGSGARKCVHNCITFLEASEIRQKTKQYKHFVTLKQECICKLHHAGGYIALDPRRNPIYCLYSTSPM